ncbi:MAG: hypothetical protein GY869_09235, partial [Planctomycetes bacterium]|nr:hypothetical protein [Planctomycetota bacterium]
QGTDTDWAIVEADTIAAAGSVTLTADMWAMYFLHWRPLTPEREKLSPEYVRDLLLNFWGPEMPFTLSDNDGETTVAGHPAHYIDGTIYDGKIHTRFIVWNCPETRRQLIADCNYNASMGTPRKFLNLQFDFTASLACHPQAPVQTFASLTKKSDWPQYNLSFYTTDDWRSHEFNAPQWFPEGLNDTNGTL